LFFQWFGFEPGVVNGVNELVTRNPVRVEVNEGFFCVAAQAAQSMLGMQTFRTTRSVTLLC
jgi:hypothetical protein